MAKLSEIYSLDKLRFARGVQANYRANNKQSKHIPLWRLQVYYSFTLRTTCINPNRMKKMDTNFELSYPSAGDPPHLECFHFLHTRTHRAVSHQSANYNHTYRCHDAINDESIEQDQPDDHQEIEQPKSNLSESNRGTARASVFVHSTTNARIELNPLKNVSND